MQLKSLHGNIVNGLEFVRPPESFREALIKAFTFPNPQYLQAARFSPYGKVSLTIPREIILAENTDDGIRVPRGLEPNDLPAKARTFLRQMKWRDQRTEAPVVFPARKIALNREQRQLYTNFVDLVEKGACPFGNVLYVAPTSAGKTILQMALADYTGQRTLVLCLTDLIKRAWIQDIEKCYGLAPRDVGLIQQQTWRIGKHITLASVRTLARRRARWSELFDTIGTVILDEAHTIAAPSVYEFIDASPAKYLIGATATEGTSSAQLTAYFGRTRKKLFAQQKDTDTSLALKTVRRVTTSFSFDYKHDQPIDWLKLSEAMSLDEERNGLIVHTASRDWRKGHSVLVVTKRVPHAHLLHEMLVEAGVSDANLLTGDTNADRFYTEKLVEAVNDRSVRMIVATVEAIKLGANLPQLEILHVAMPVVKKHNLEQLIGRIRRRPSGKSVCELVYYDDRNVRYLANIFKRTAIPVLRKLRVPGFTNRFEA